MKEKHCRCCIVPSFVFDVLVNRRTIAKEDLELTYKESEEIRSRRITVNNEIIGKSVSNVIRGEGDRYVYDSKNTSKGRYVLIRKEGSLPVPDETVNLAYDNSGVVREYFKNAYNYLSIDNNGKSLILNVHYLKDFNNAFWDNGTDEMYFGDGDGHIFINLVRALDVTAHELSHGVIEYTAGLKYSGQSGALNEHFADVFATVIKQHSYNQTANDADWLIGNEIVGASFPGKAIRSMKEPGTAFSDDPQPSHMRDYYKGEDDNFGVHINSGILNRAFYLAASGISGLDGLETDKAGLLWFETLKVIPDTCNFMTFYEAVLKMAQTLHTRGKLRKDSYYVVGEAFKSVGLF